MPREIFGSVTDPSARRRVRNWPTVLLSFIAHAFALAMLLVIPLMATGALPVPRSGAMVMAVLPPPLPVPPPAPRASAPKPVANPDAAPVSAPEGIKEEPDIDSGFEKETEPIGDFIGGSEKVIDVAIVEPPPAPKAAAPPPVRIGGLIKQPQKIHDVPAVYPPIAIAAHIEGIVIIEATIGVDGRVQDARVLRPFPILEQAALDAVRQWIYTPTTLNGVAVPVIMTVTVRFTLQR